MKIFNKLWGIKSDKWWIKALAIVYYFWCLILVVVSLNAAPEIYANIYDLFIYKSSKLLIALSFFVPTLFISDFKIKEKIPIIKKKKWWTDFLGFIIIFILILCCSKLVNMCHSNDYLQRYDEYLQTEIIYKKHDPDKIPEEDKSSLTENQLESDFENLTNEANKNGDNKVIPESDENNVQNSTIKVHYIDVGQGDSIFIELPNQQTMLIDAGESSKGQIVSNYITKLDYSKIDYLIGTHPHTDHIGGLAHIINNFDIGKIYMPKAISTSKTYENLLNTISAKALTISTAKAGVNILTSDNLSINIIAPNSDSYSNLNNYSAVIKINYGNRKFLFMGDAETKSEREITTDVTADVIKIGHHGSDTSSGQTFVNRVKAEYAIIMVGANNQYNHPYQSIIDRWTNIGAKIYRTDLNGTIIITSDGTSLNVSSSK
ncbi:MAG: MBL fold metallo-hydrolase [bacterium]|nr:MBL fold metallo-hydrolase [bacterium]